MRSTSLLTAVLLLLAGCDGDEPGADAAISDGATSEDAAISGDAATSDGAVPDAGGDDAAVSDAGSDAGFDGGAAPRGPMVVYVSLSGDDEILALSLDADTGALAELSRVPAGDRVGALAVRPDASALYAAFRGDGSIGAYAIASDGQLSAVGEASVGVPVVYLSVDDSGQTLLWASYGADRIQTHAIGAGGAVGAMVSGFDTETNPHSIVLDPTNRFALVPNTNSDVIQQYVFDAASGALSRNTPSEVSVDAGTGPRHLVFHPTLDLVYVVNEHADSVSRFALADDGTIALLDSISTLPSGVDGSANTCADIHVLPDGSALYASNRGHDSIAVFTLDDEGEMTAAGHTPTEPRPREFDIDPSGRWLFAAGLDSGNLASYAIEDDGSLTPLDVIPVGDEPLWVEVVELPGG